MDALINYFNERSIRSANAQLVETHHKKKKTTFDQSSHLALTRVKMNNICCQIQADLLKPQGTHWLHIIIWYVTNFECVLQLLNTLKI